MDCLNWNSVKVARSYHQTELFYLTKTTLPPGVFITILINKIELVDKVLKWLYIRVISTGSNPYTIYIGFKNVIPVIRKKNPTRSCHKRLDTPKEISSLSTVIWRISRNEANNLSFIVTSSTKTRAHIAFKNLVWGSALIMDS